MKVKMDEVDYWGFSWAHQRRICMGLAKPSSIEPRERIGKLRCTLAQGKDERSAERVEQVSEFGNRSQDWPEVHTGMGLIIHLCLQHVAGLEKLTAIYQWVERHRTVKVKAEEMGVSPARYWTIFGNLKSFIRGYAASSPGVYASRAALDREQIR